MLRSKSLTNLIYETNNKPIYYNIKLQNPDIFSFVDTPENSEESPLKLRFISVFSKTYVSENIIDITHKYSNKSIESYSNFLHKNPNATKEQRREAIRVFYENLSK